MIRHMRPDDDPAARRRRARGSWPVAAFPLGAEPGDDLRGRTTPAERIAMMWPLAVDAWASAGRRLPEYTRDRMPGRVIRKSCQPAAER